MRRLFWLAAGAAVTVVVARKAQKAAHAFTPAGLADRVADARVWAREFADEVRAGSVERELELREALGLDAEDISKGAV